MADMKNRHGMLVVVDFVAQTCSVGLRLFLDSSWTSRRKTEV
jgi:hypothetical protein